MVLWIIGAFVSGTIFTAVGGDGMAGFNLCSMVASIIGAIVVLVLYHTAIGRT
jgi:uncharacterized membrane protein YeaQ/YmgE (transglycosylase-associated protein family)